MLGNCAIIFADNNVKMNSSIPSLFLQVLFKPMIFWVTDALGESLITDICVVSNSSSVALNECIKEKREMVFNKKQQPFHCSFADTFDFLSSRKGQNVLVLSAPTPFIDRETIESSLGTHINSKNDVTIIKETTDSINRKDIGLISKKAYWFNVYSLLHCFNKINEKTQISDIIEVYSCSGKKVGFYTAKYKESLLSAENRKGLNRLNEIARKRELEKHMLSGVDMPCTDGIIISCGAKIGSDTTILPNTIIKDNVTIGSFCTIGPNAVIENCKIEDNSTFSNTVARDSAIGSSVSVGPFAHIRPDSNIKNNVRIGNFVEIKNSFVDSNAKLSHFLYVGDCDVGKKVNFGCGSITVNYTGKYKYRTTINDGAFIGCNSNLIAPVTVGKDAYIAAGSTITENVPDKSLAIARERQTIKENWVTEKKPYK